MKNKLKFSIRTMAVLTLIVTSLIVDKNILEAGDPVNCLAIEVVDSGSCFGRVDCIFYEMRSECNANGANSTCFSQANEVRHLGRNDCLAWFEDPRIDHSGCDFLNEVHNGHGS